MLAIQEAIDPTVTGPETLVAQFEQSARSAESAWWAALRSYEAHANESALTYPPWRMDMYDRIY